MLHRIETDREDARPCQRREEWPNDLVDEIRADEHEGDHLEQVRAQQASARAREPRPARPGGHLEDGDLRGLAQASGPWGSPVQAGDEAWVLSFARVKHATTVVLGTSRIQAALDAGPYPIGIKVSAVEMEAIRLERSDFHGEWNYTIRPQ